MQAEFRAGRGGRSRPRRASARPAPVARRSRRASAACSSRRSSSTAACCRKRPSSRPTRARTCRGRQVNDTTQAGAILAENATITAQDATFASTTLKAWKYTSKLIAVSWELIQDSFFNIDELVGELAGTRLGRILNTHFTVGTRLRSSQPNGVVTAATSGKTGIVGQTLTVIYDDLMDLVYSVDVAYRPRAIWMMNDPRSRSFGSSRTRRAVRSGATSTTRWRRATSPRCSAIASSRTTTWR
jgi:hypothetical protein